MFDAGKNSRMIELPYGEKNYDDMLSRFHTIPACHGQTDRQTDRRTDGQNCYINIARQCADARKKSDRKMYFQVRSISVLVSKYVSK